MSDIAIRVEKLGKRYRIGAKEEGYKNFREIIVDAAKAPIRNFRRLRKLTKFEDNPSKEQGAKSKESNPMPHAPCSMPSSPDDVIWALKDVSFDVHEGEVIGIIGRNGAGKSTLLKLLSRITEPTEGYAEIRGRVSSLLEVGTGFHPELTGRENIYLNGSILGMRKCEIDKRFDEIVEFSEIEKFLDTPVKRYSSGMYVRLAFAVAAHLDPEILIVDEVLAVGDVAFQKKCLGKMQDVSKGGRTVLFVSHNMAAIKRLCHRALCLVSGRLQLDGPADILISKYLTNDSSVRAERIWENGIANPGVNELQILGIRVLNSTGELSARLEGSSAFYIEIAFRVLKSITSCRIGVRVTTVNGVIVFESYDTDDDCPRGSRKLGHYTIRSKIPGNFLSPGRYILSINAGIPNIKNLAFIENALLFDIEDTGIGSSEMDHRRAGIIRTQFHWEKEVHPD